VKTQLHLQKAIPLVSLKGGNVGPGFPQGGKQIIVEVFPLCCLCALYFPQPCCVTLENKKLKSQDYLVF